MAIDPRKVNQKAPTFGDRRTKRGRDRSTRNRKAVADAMPYCGDVDLTPYAGVDPADVPTYDDDDYDYDPNICGFCGDSIESCDEIRSRDDY